MLGDIEGDAVTFPKELRDYRPSLKVPASETKDSRQL